jgi:hypothetical protein
MIKPQAIGEQDTELYELEHESNVYFIRPTKPDREHWCVVKQEKMSDLYLRYDIAIRSKKFVCSCEGFRRAGLCRHIEMVKSVL